MSIFKHTTRSQTLTLINGLLRELEDKQLRNEKFIYTFTLGIANS